MGPTEFVLNAGIDIRPHPHINLATVTYLFDGEITHRDSLGTQQVIRPGAVNWMSAGSGIVHSERSGAEFRKRSGRMFGLQNWVALPAAHEEDEPFFAHTDKQQLPLIQDHGVEIRLVTGSGWGQQSPVATLTDTIYADIALTTAAQLPLDAEHEERAVYIVAGAIDVGGTRFAAEQLLVLRPGKAVTLYNPGAVPARLLLFGGETMDGRRFTWWNSGPSRRERIEQAKAEWKAGRFDTVPGD